MSLLKRIPEPDEKRAKRSARPEEPSAEFYAELRDALFQRIAEWTHVTPDGLVITDRFEEVRASIDEHFNNELALLLDKQPIPASMPRNERKRLRERLLNELFGYGPLEELLEDEQVTTIWVHHYESISVERGGVTERTALRFKSEAHLVAILNRIQVPFHPDEKFPLIETLRMPDGSRITIGRRTVASFGPFAVIRKFTGGRYTSQQYIETGAITPEVMEFLTRCQSAPSARPSILICGGSRSGKTALTNVLASLIPQDDRIFQFEQPTEELYCRHEQVFRVTYSEHYARGLTARDVMAQAENIQPDHIVVNDLLGEEAYPLLRLMARGFPALAAIPAETAEESLSMLVRWCEQAQPGSDGPALVAHGLRIVVEMELLAGGRRHVSRIAEVTGVEAGRVALADLFAWDRAAGVLKPTGRLSMWPSGDQ